MRNIESYVQMEYGFYFYSNTLHNLSMAISVHIH